jgi:nicotinamide-nucleotide amidase
MSAAILCTGTELTRGELLNSNATWLAEALTALGFEVAVIETVGDDRERIGSALVRLGRDHDVITCTGGLGPTTDDLTTEVVAGVLGLPLVRDEPSLQKIRARFEKAGRTMTPSNEKQADFPRGAAILPNENGTAPGFCVTIGRAVAAFLPGVPSEMMPMFEASVVPKLASIARQETHQIRLRTYGLAESTVNDRLRGIEATHGVTIGYRARIPEIEVKVLATGELAETRAVAAAKEVRTALGDVVYGEGDTTFAATLLTELGARNATLALGESCTGGLVAELLTDVPGSSRAFLGGVVAYSNAAKSALLGVEPALIETHGAVSEEVARAMAEGARARFGATLAVGVTGIAGPDGGSADKPVGLVHFAVAGQRGTTAKAVTFTGNRSAVRMRAAFAALAFVRRAMLEDLE